jgi:hypothetical protein
MVSWRPAANNEPMPGAGKDSVHIVVIAWLYVTFAMALAMPGFASGVAFFALAGLLPALLVAALAGRRLRRRRAQATAPSAIERDVNRRDDADAKPDQ